MSTGPHYPIHLPGNPNVDWINMPHKDAEIERLRTRIADLEAAGRLLGAEVYIWRDRHCSLRFNRMGYPQYDATNSHPTAARFVKEAGDGH